MTDVANMIRDAVDHHLAGDLDCAEDRYHRILRRDPDNPGVLHLLGALAHQRGRDDEAVDLLRRAIAVDDSVAEFHNTFGAVLHALGRSDESLNAYRKAILLKPDYAEAYNNIAMVWQSRASFSKAVAYYERAVQLAPDSGDIHYNLGNALRSEGRLSEAADEYAKALKLKPDHAESHNNLGMTRREQGQIDRAIECYKRAIRLNPGCARFHSNLASALQHQGRLAEAIVHCERAIGLDPGSAEGHYNLGSALRDAGRCDEAIEQNNLAIRLRPDYAEAHWNQGIVYLLKGNFHEGWREYEWRRKTDWHASAYPHRHQKPRWDGQSFVGKRLLVHCEQGVGDCIQFVRYLPMVKALGGTVVFEAWKSLHGLLKGFDGVDELVELSFEEKTQTQFDAHVSIMDLPGLFGTSESTIPTSVPYIQADPAKAAYWRQELAGPELKVGIVWAGSARHTNDHNRSCRFEHFAPLSQIEGVRLYSLQKGEPARQAVGSSFVSRASRPGTAGFKSAAPLTPQPDVLVPNLGERLEDFTDTAAAIESLDLIISVDTAVLHLAGAMGKPTWALLAFAPDWRWMLERADSPWYPTVRLFRQTKWGDWDAVVETVAQELRVLADKRNEVHIT